MKSSGLPERVVFIARSLFGLALVVSLASALQAAPAPAPRLPTEELLVASAPEGKPGGRLTVALQAEPKILNPLLAIDQPSRDVIGRVSGDLIHIHALTQKAEPALAKSWTVSADGLKYRLNLRRGIRFSDGQPFDADD